MSAKKTLLIALLGIHTLHLLCSDAWAWRTNINGTANGSDWANAVAVDAAGNVVAAGSTQNTGTGQNFTVVKFDGVSGQELWRQRINGSDPNSYDYATAVAVDAAGNVVAAGITEYTGTFSNFTVIKFNGLSGTELWRKEIGDGLAYAVAVDTAGNVVAAGVTHNIDTSHDFTVVKFDGVSGAELWRQVVSGTGSAYESAYAVTVDAAGNVVAAGTTENTDTGYDFTVVKFDGVSGAELWRQVINATNGDGFVLSLALDGAGNVVAAGLTNGTCADFECYVYVSNFTVVKFDGVSGAELWRQVINGTASGYGAADAVAVDAGGNVVAAGATDNTGTGSDFTVVKFDGVSGTELWRQAINGTSANSFDFAYAVAVDAAGNVVAAGVTQNTGTGSDFTVVKLPGTPISPNPIDLAAPPPSFTITGEGFANLGFGLSVVNFTRNGFILAAARATAGTSTSLTIPFSTGAGSNLGWSAGPVTVEVYNQTGPGSFSIIGSSSLMVMVSDTRPPPGVNSITPTPIDLAAPPTSFTITGGSFADSGFGLSVVNFTRNGFILAAARATSGTNTSLTVPFPGTNGGSYEGLSAGAVSVDVYNQTGSNSWNFLGSTSLMVNDTRPPPGVSSITPNPMDIATPPANFTVTGNGFMNSGFGLSVVNFTRNGAILAAARATSGTDTTLTVPFPGTNGGAYEGLGFGPVTVEVWNQTGANSWKFVGSTPLRVIGEPRLPLVNSITPDPMDLAVSPAGFTITGNGFMDSGFGLSVANFTRNGFILAAARASSGTNTSLTVPFSNGGGSNLGWSAGPVTAEVYNQIGANSWSFVGSTSLTVNDTRPAPGVSSITPNPIDLATPPASFTINGNGFVDSGFGLSVVNFTRNGAILAAARATAGTNTSLTVPFSTGAGSNLGWSAGPVTAEVYNQTGSNNWSFVGSITLTVTDSALTQSPADSVGPA